MHVEIYMQKYITRTKYTVYSCDHSQIILFLLTHKLIICLYICAVRTAKSKWERDKQMHRLAYAFIYFYLLTSIQCCVYDQTVRLQNTSISLDTYSAEDS